MTSVYEYLRGDHLDDPLEPWHFLVPSFDASRHRGTRAECRTCRDAGVVPWRPGDDNPGERHLHIVK